VVAGILGKDEDMTSNIFRGTWLTILVVGAVVAGFQAKPLTAILVAQYANGLVLPVMAMVLIGLANQVKVDADVDAFGDSTRQFAALVVVVFCLLLAVIKLV
jgi:Mn2+/Fe2+ NRAMP family transporter